jgi:hypothetical protein
MRATFKTAHLYQLVLMGLVLAGCKQPKTFRPTFTDTYQINTTDSYDQADALLQADYLFVLDTSFSMQDELTDLANSMDEFADYLSGSSIDYRVGFVSGNVHGTFVTPCTSNGWAANCFASSLAFMGGDFFSPSTTSAGFQTIVDTIGQPLQPNRVFALEAADRSIDTLGSSFLRDSAQLVYVFVAGDDDEFTSRAPASYISSLKAAKSDDSYVSSRAFVYTDSVCEPSGGYQNGEGGAPRIAEVSQGLDSLATPAACLADPNASLLEDLARNVTRPTDRFKLLGTPVAGTLQVIVNGTPMSSGFTLNAASNEVIFASGSEPALSASLRFEYEVAFVLSKSPKLDTVVVEVNGAKVSKSDSNGWSYLESEKRIVFNGASKPANGSNVKVSYEVL